MGVLQSTPCASLDGQVYGIGYWNNKLHFRDLVEGTADIVIAQNILNHRTTYSTGEFHDIDITDPSTHWHYTTAHAFRVVAGRVVRRC